MVCSWINSSRNLSSKTFIWRLCYFVHSNSFLFFKHFPGYFKLCVLALKTTTTTFYWSKTRILRSMQLNRLIFTLVWNLTFKMKINLRFSSFQMFAKVYICYKTLVLEAVHGETPMNLFIYSSHRYLWSAKRGPGCEVHLGVKQRRSLPSSSLRTVGKHDTKRKQYYRNACNGSPWQEPERNKVCDDREWQPDGSWLEVNQIKTQKQSPVTFQLPCLFTELWIQSPQHHTLYLFVVRTC